MGTPGFCGLTAYPRPSCQPQLPLHACSLSSRAGFSTECHVIPQRICDNAWGYFLLSQLGERCYGYPVDGGRGRSWHPTLGHGTGPPTKGHQPQMSTGPRSRTLTWRSPTISFCLVHVTLSALLLTFQATSALISILQQQKHSRSPNYICYLPYRNMPPTSPIPAPWMPFPIFFNYQLTWCSKVLPLLGRPTRKVVLAQRSALSLSGPRRFIFFYHLYACKPNAHGLLPWMINNHRWCSGIWGWLSFFK